MGILDGIVAWFAEQVMNILDLINSSVLGALGCDMSTFTRYFPAAETMYNIFVALGIGLILLNLVWQLFKNFGSPIGIEAEDPVKLVLRSMLFILLVYGLSNAVTRFSQDVDSYDRATDLETIGYKILTMPKKQWNRLNTMAA